MHPGLECHSPSSQQADAGSKNDSNEPTISSCQDLQNGTKIDVFVRCRGRNEKEVQENSSVVVNADGVKGKKVELTMGGNAQGNKTYSFDQVFSPTADQQIIFDEVVQPVLDEVSSPDHDSAGGSHGLTKKQMLQGFNCTIFAYGQTGTGKTYTMSGDIADHPVLPDDSGIIPRVLQYVFSALDALPQSPTGGAAPENSVKVSFIELYNEELRDLLSSEERSNLKIFEGDSRRGTATVVQGMEERYITSARKGIQLLRIGGQKRQVASTKCNDLSSRSHTVFTVTVYQKRTLDSGEEIFSAGKLNLVDLAGSENIGRSGAEHQRATEAGLINKSLLTLGRVINALVDRSAHIPYRGSKLTRLLQDSLGGRTKTCIIATISPARSSLEETISTLDYAFRAKNIKNKPQLDRSMPKKTLLKELTGEIEKLKSELSATRQRHGVYLTPEAYDELTTESEALGTLVKEQRERIETVESKLSRKGHDLVELTSQLDHAKKEGEAMRGTLNSTKLLLETERTASTHTKLMLRNETAARQRSELTEQQLRHVIRNLTEKVDQSTADVTGLHLKLQRRSDLHTRNREQFVKMQKDVGDTVAAVDAQLLEFRTDHQKVLDALSGRMRSFFQQEMIELSTAREELERETVAFGELHQEMSAQTVQGENGLDNVTREVKMLRNELKAKVETRFADMGAVLKRIHIGIQDKMEVFHSQLQSSYAGFGEGIKTISDDLSKKLAEQHEEVQRLWSEMTEANHRLQETQSQSINTLSSFASNEKAIRDREHTDLMEQIQKLFAAKVQQQELRLDMVTKGSADLTSALQRHSDAVAVFTDSDQQLTGLSNGLKHDLDLYRNMMESRCRNDSTMIDTHTASLKTAACSVHEAASHIMDEQAQHLDTDMLVLDDIACRIQEQNEASITLREQLFSRLTSTVHASNARLDDTFHGALGRVERYLSSATSDTGKMCESLSSLDEEAHVRRQMADLSRRTERDMLEDYVKTGHTPMRRRYDPPMSVPHPSTRATFVDGMRTENLWEPLPSKSKSPGKMLVFADDENASEQHTAKAPFIAVDTSDHGHIPSLCELDVNTMSRMEKGSVASTEGAARLEKEDRTIDTLAVLPSLKRPPPVSASAESKAPAKRHRTRRSLSICNSLAFGDENEAK